MMTKMIVVRMRMFSKKEFFWQDITDTDTDDSDEDGGGYAK